MLMYRVRVETEFCAAHKIEGYPGKCNQLHGHNWKVEVLVRSEKLNDLGMVVDFCLLKELVRKITQELDHKYLNELPAFSEKAPTSEVLAEYISLQLNNLLNGVELEEVRVWETNTAYGAYSQESSS